MTTNAADFEVGISATVVPNGIEYDKECAFCRLSISLSPTKKTAANSLGTVDVRVWPAQIAELTRQMVVHVEGVGTVPKIPPDVRPGEMERFKSKATSLWQRIFTDGAESKEAGFVALFGFLTKDRAPTAFDNAPTVSSPTGQLSCAIDGMSASAVATSLLQRAALKAVAKERLTAVEKTALLEASSPSASWWTTLHDQALISELENDSSLRIDAHTSLEKRSGDPARYFTREVANPTFWRNTHTSQSGRGSLQAFRFAHLRHMISMKADAGAGSTNSKKLTPEEVAMSKYAGLLCLPTLAKYLGLIIDIRVEASSLAKSAGSARSRGQVAVTLDGPNLPVAGQAISARIANEDKDVATPSVGTPAELIWTAYVLTWSQGGGFEYFGPRESAETETQRGADGLLRLGEKNGNATRFQLCTLDVTDAAEKIMKLSVDSKSQKAPNETKSFPELLTRGIVLLDTLREKREQQEKDRRNKKSEADSHKVLYAEDLTVGYEIDVALVSKSSQLGERPPSARWRTLMARTVRYGRDVDPSFYQLPAIRRQRERDDGHVKLMVKKKEDDGTLMREVHQELFTWTGESLAIPHIAPQCFKVPRGRKNTIAKNEIGVCPEALTVDTMYDLPRESDEAYRKAPPLREGRGYMFGARVRFLNGCSLSFRDAVKRYSKGEEDVILGKDSRNPFVYRRRCAIHAPEVLLDWNDRIVAARDSCALAKEARGETITELVIRSGKMRTDTTARYLVPPRVTFDLAEQAALFDHDFTPRPAGAFRGRVKAQLDKNTGAFAVARCGKWSFPSDPENNCASSKKCKDDSKNKERRGSVFLLDSQAQGPDVGYYPDASARQVCARFQDAGLSLSNFDSNPCMVDFWPIGSTALAAEPVILSLKKGRREPKRLLGWFDRADGKTEVSEVHSSSRVQLKKLAVTLAPGAVVNLELYSIPSFQGTGKHHALAEAIDLLRDAHSSGEMIEAKNFGVPQHQVNAFRQSIYELVAADERQDKACEDLLSQGPIPQLTTKQVVKLVHAVDCPVAPRFLTCEGEAVGGRGSDFRHASESAKLLRIFPINIAAPTVIQNDAGTSQQRADKSTDQTGNTSLQSGSAKSNLQKRWAEYVDSNESWSGFVSENGTLLKPTQDADCNWRPDGGRPVRHGGTAISEQEQCQPRLDRRCWQGEEGGVTTFFAGEVLVDRLTTGRLRCEARWLEYSPSIIRRNGVSGPWIVDAPNRFAKLFEIDQVETEERLNPPVGRCAQFPSTPSTVQNLDKLDLLRNSAGNLRNLAYPFVDGRARRLFVQLMATSRFTNYFPKGETEEATTEKLRDTEAIVWLPSTFRPAQPEIDRILPLFRWHVYVHDEGREITWKRESSLRIYMGRNWFSSGEGEKLGLVCWPKNLFGSSRQEEARSAVGISRDGLNELDPTLDSGDDNEHHPFRKYGQYITRWGADPIRLSGALDEAMSVDRFEPKFTEKVTKTLYSEDLLLFLPDAHQTFDSTDSNESKDLKEKGAQPLPVCVLTYDVSFDTKEGNWYSDITIDHGSSYFPFVQLGLVRYQAHAGRGLELSFPATALAQIPPIREGYVKFIGENRLYLEVTGIGFHRSETDPYYADERDKSDFPHLDIKLMKAEYTGDPNDGNENSPNWQPALDTHGNHLEWRDEIPQQRGAQLVWTKTIRLPEQRVRYAILLEEYEYMVTDKLADDQHPLTSADIKFTTCLFKRGPLFSHMIEVTAPKAALTSEEFVPSVRDVLA